MSTLSDILPKDSKVVDAIYSYYKETGEKEPLRKYLGASQIGHPCDRYLWYSFRHCCKSNFDGRMYRLFATGDIEEMRFTADLQAIGCKVYTHDENGNQFAISDFGGHFSGHLDGAAIGIPEAPKTWHVMEYKTHNSKSFEKLKKDGVSGSKPQHYAQCQVYMHKTGMTRTLYLGRNKDTDELYSERIRYDKEQAELLMQRAKLIITSTTPPERPFPNQDFYQCEWCDAKAICWGIQEERKYQALKVPFLSCRQCCHATPQLDGNQEAWWRCEKKNCNIIEEEPCENHLCLPGLFAFAEPTHYSDGHIEFKNFSEEKEWVHGGVFFTSKELMSLSQQQLEIGVQKIKIKSRYLQPLKIGVQK